ncbi:tRNA (adenosine(37)-N6)-threonylcarbamoyltransferase complex ATPase subunit type 1 TsaE [Chitinophaga horti]|uniref:tRNA threonylcarbamoyladenosine biosynthesis protein TsaE n=1 Tax=Chitinophaga horti TaxID=2920382 RepID=A0ABY6J3T2_9BACT|nr:tRNA (adenosine(37)-N6)-threonylcarbamoyltransferase complex ATPase subunit type 1 TsaE [Chitinophaga horti]UYQ93292.1 tRNA (adenosine(37)-N6)-threonylcarbamoyltransferase complex ATPase subunit type 1 TsaE [Chitinophaga horti]
MEMTFTFDELPAAASRFWAQFPQQRVFVLHGQMGAGKTTFVKALCAAKGVEDATASPTFSIINEYQYHDADGKARSIYHLDLYRLKSGQEAVEAGVEDTLYQEDATCFVEWPEIVEELLPEGTIHLQLEVLPDQKRRLTARASV